MDAMIDENDLREAVEATSEEFEVWRVFFEGRIAAAGAPAAVGAIMSLAATIESEILDQEVMH